MGGGCLCIVSQGAGWSFGDDVVPPEIKMTKNFGLAVLWLSALVAIVLNGKLLDVVEDTTRTLMYISCSESQRIAMVTNRLRQRMPPALLPDL